jgi:hypothetical protein
MSFEMDELTEEWYGILDDKTALIIYGGNRGYWSNKIYTHPAQPWQGLTDDEIARLVLINEVDKSGDVGFYKLIEQALKDKNT